MKSCTEKGDQHAQKYCKLCDVFVCLLKITRMGNERCVHLICDKFNVLKICSSGNCERKCTISYDIFFLTARQPYWAEASSSWFLQDT